MKRFLGSFLASALLISLPGPHATNAFAQVVAGANAAAGYRGAPISVVPVNTGGSAGIGSALGTTGASLNTTLPASLALPVLNSNAAALMGHGAVNGIAPSVASVGIPAQGIAPQALNFQNAPGRIAPSAASKGIVPQNPANGPAARFSARRTLEQGVKKIEKGGSAGSFSALRNLFTGSKIRGGDAVNLAVEGTEDSGREAAKLRSAETIESLETKAIDAKADQSERIAAVKKIVQFGAPDAPKALERIAGANPAGGAADYEVHRAALRALAVDFGDVRSLRPITIAHADEILKKIESQKPEMAFFDYDDTLADFNTPISDEVGAALAAASNEVDTFILTDRNDVKQREKEITITDSLSPMSAAQKSKVTLFSARGTRLSMFDKKGNTVLLDEHEIAWDEKELGVIKETVGGLIEKYGEGEFDGKTEFSNGYSYSKLLPAGTPAATVKEAAAWFTEQLKARGLDVEAVGRTAKKETDPPYLSISKIDKSLSVVPTRKNRRVFEQVRDLMRIGAGGRVARAAYKVLRKLPGRSVAAKDTIVVGDQFFDTRIADTGFIKGAPGALALSVGNTGDPRLENLFVWPKEAAEGSLQILKALAAKAPSQMNKKAVAGMFAQRTVSISVFILTAIAYPFVAVPVVGWAGYGALMAFGPLAAIATGPLNGLIVDHLSARNAMALNTAVRVVLNLVLPVLAFTGVLNFATLLVASIANGWLLSSIMTTEGAYVKSLAGERNIGAVNGLLWMNYLFIQVVLALILGIGSVVDIMNPLHAFTISAAVHALVVLPIIWFTMPKISPSPKTLESMGARLAKVQAAQKSATGEKHSKLVQEEIDLKKALVARKAFLTKDIADNKAAIAANDKALAEARAETPEGIRAKLDRASRVRFLVADNGMRAKSIVQAEAELSGVKKSDRIMSGLKGFMKNNWKQTALFAASVGTYVVMTSANLPVAAAVTAISPLLTQLLASTLPIIGALVYWISTTDSFKALWFGRGGEPTAEQQKILDKIAANEKAVEAGAENAGALKAENKKLGAENAKWQNRLRTVMLLLALSALFLYPLQYFALPKIALAVAGTAGKGALYGKLLGALFFGNLIANSAKSRLPDAKLPLIGRIPGERIIQSVVTALAGIWFYTDIVPGSLLASAAAALVTAGLIALSSKLTDKAWVKFLGLGFSAIWLPYFFFGGIAGIPAAAVIMAAMVSMGMFYGPAFVSLSSYFQRNARAGNMGRMIGAQGSMFSAAVSTGYGLLTLAASFFDPTFPGLLAVLGAFYIIGGLLFWKAPGMLPGFPKTMLHPKKDAK